MYRVLLFLLVSTGVYAQIEFEDYKIKNSDLHDVVYSQEQHSIYIDRSCITDWGTGEGQCKDNYGTYKITRIDTVAVVEMYANGNVRRELFYYTKKRLKQVIVYHPKTGNKFAELEYDGKKLLNVNYFDPNGKSLDHGSFKDGNGVLVFYRYNGTKLHVSHYKDGLASGPTTYYFGNGRVMMQGSYKFGRPDGEWYEYSLNGEKLQLTKMAMGYLVKTSKL